MQRTDYVEVPIYARDGSLKAHTKVDPDVAVWVLEHRWFLNRGYVCRTTYSLGSAATRKSRPLYLARAICGLERGNELTVDHINRDKQDNRRANLRVIPRHGQAANRATHRVLPRGVSETLNGRYIAHATVARKRHHLGTFDSPEEAGQTASAWRLENMPFAVD